MSEEVPMHPHEEERLAAVYSLNILDTPPDPRYDAITRKVTEQLHVPMSTVTILDKNREWFKSCQGIDIKEGPRNAAFCSWALLAKNIFIVSDTLLDDRFKNNIYVVGEPHVRFYAGVALYDHATHLPVGVLCAKDTKPHEMTPEEIDALLSLAEEAEALLNAGKDKNQ